MTVVIRQEAKFSFMPEILAANIVVGPLPRVKTVALGELGNPEATCLSFDFLSPECSKKDFTVLFLEHKTNSGDTFLTHVNNTNHF